MDEVGTVRIRPSVIQTSNQFGSATQAYEFFRDGAAGAHICDPRLVGSRDAFRFKARSIDLGTAVLIDGSVSPMVTQRSAQMIARAGIDHYQISLSIRGGGGMTSNARTMEFEPGDVYIVDLSQPNSFHHGAKPDGPDSHVLTLVMPRDLLAPLLAEADGVHGNVVSHKTAFGRLIADHMLALRSHAPHLDDGECRAAVAGMAHLAAGAFGLAADAAPSVADSIRDARIKAIKRHIERNLGSARLEIGDLCRAFNLSRTALYRLFQSDGGIARYIQQRRLYRAHAMLMGAARPNWRIVDFAVEAQFSSDATFIRAFRRTFGTTPSEVRAQAELARLSHRRARASSTALFDATRWAREPLL